MRSRRPSRLPPILVLAAGLVAAPAIGWIALAQAPDAPPAPDPAAAPLVEEGRSYAVTFASPDDPSLEGPMRDASTLQQLAGEGPIPPAILLRRALTDRGRFASVLRSEGYFEGDVAIDIAGVPADDAALDARIAALPADAPIPVVVTARPGRRTMFGPSRLLAPDGSTLSPAAREAFALPEGQPARGADVLAAERRAIDALRSEGHAFARFVGRDAVVNHDTDLMTVATTLEPGPRVSIGQIGIDGTDRLSERAVRRRAGLAPGTPFSPEAVERARRAVTLFPSVGEVRAVLGTEPEADGTVPLTFAITERPRRVLSVATDYATDEGARISGEWSHRNILGEGETLTGRLEANRILSNGWIDIGALASLRLTALDVWRRDQTGDLELKLEREREEAYDRDAATATGTLSRLLAPGITVRAGLSLDASEVTDAGETDTYFLLGLPLGAVVDRRNSLLDPTSGVRAAVAVTPELPLAGDTPSFTRTRFDLSALLDVSGDGGTVLAGRTTLGLLFGADDDQIPADRRYYAGGGSSVRGYPFQSLGPRDSSGDVRGGGSLLELSAELRQRVAGEWGMVAFVDAGNAYESRTPEGDLKIGAGLGVRYRSPVGPIRLDVAVPLSSTEGGSGLGFEFYAGIGQAF